MNSRVRDGNRIESLFFIADVDSQNLSVNKITFPPVLF